MRLLIIWLARIICAPLPVVRLAVVHVVTDYVAVVIADSAVAGFAAAYWVVTKVVARAGAIGGALGTSAYDAY